MTDQSDIDLRIDKGAIRGLAFAGLLGDLEDALGTHVDLISIAGMDDDFCGRFRKMRYCSMKAPDRDLQLLKHIVSYCKQIDMAVERFGASYSIFTTNLSNAVFLCISKHLDNMPLRPL